MLYTHLIGNQAQNTVIVFKMHDSVRSRRYSSVYNVESGSSLLRESIDSMINFVVCLTAEMAELFLSFIFKIIHKHY